MAKILVILGAGLGGLPLAHHLLKNHADRLGLKVILVSPSDEFYWNLASVRAALPGQIDDGKIFFPIPEAFSAYGKDIFEFVPAVAKTWDPTNNKVVLALNEGSERTIDYHTIFVATGSSAKNNMPWKALGTSATTRKSLDKLRTDIEKANSIIVGGAGATGTEFAAELGYEYAKLGKKKVTLISSETLLLGPEIMKSTRETAKKEVLQLGVDVITETKVTSIEYSTDGTTVLKLTKADGSVTTIETDLYVSTVGNSYNSGFASPEMVNSNGRFKVNDHLQAPSHENAFIFGDVADVESPTASPLDSQLRFLGKLLTPYFAGGSLPEYSPSTMVMMGLSLGRDRGTGQMGPIKPFSILIWYAKGRYLGTDYAHEYAAGKKLVKGSW